MKQFLLLLLLAVSLISATHCASAKPTTFESEAAARTFADGVMQLVAAGDLAGAFAEMKPYTILPETEFDSAALTSKSQRNLVGDRFGSTIGYEFIASKKAGESLVRLIYIEKTQKHAIPWFFYFYKGPEGWVLNSFKWNDDMPALFTYE